MHLVRVVGCRVGVGGAWPIAAPRGGARHGLGGCHTVLE